jgi:hypothetical protein
MARRRDYAAEYAQRIARGMARGLTRSRARGHPRPSEALASARTAPRYDPRLEEGIREMRAGKSLSAAARSIHRAPERLRRYAQRTGVVAKQQGRWVVGRDTRLRVVPLYSEGAEHRVRVADYDTAKKAGDYMAAVGQFLRTNDPAHLAPFVGDGVRDADGQWHPFETRPNMLYRIAASPAEPFEQVYRIVG